MGTIYFGNDTPYASTLICLHTVDQPALDRPDQVITTEVRMRFNQSIEFLVEFTDREAVGTKIR